MDTTTTTMMSPNENSQAILRYTGIAILSAMSTLTFLATAAMLTDNKLAFFVLSFLGRVGFAITGGFTAMAAGRCICPKCETESSIVV
jgi:hypothetical protein